MDITTCDSQVHSVLIGTQNLSVLHFLIFDGFGVLSTHQAHSRLANFDVTGYHHLGAGLNDAFDCEISQAHPADQLNISKFFNI